jgi:hypothetical protein
VSPRGTLIEDQAAAQREWQAANAKSQAANDLVVDYFASNPAAYYENMDLALSAPSSDLMWNRQAGPGGSMIAPETLARALEWSSSGREQYDLGFDAAGNAIAIPKGTVTLSPSDVSPATSEPAATAGSTAYNVVSGEPYVAGVAGSYPVSQPSGGIMSAIPGQILQTVAGPMTGSVYQPTVSSIPTFVSGVSDVFGTRPVTYVGSPQARIRSRLGEIDLPARPESVNVFDWLQTPVAGFGGAS